MRFRLLAELLAKNLDPVTGNLYLVEAIIESLGHRFAKGGGHPDSNLAALKDYWHYVG